MNFNIVVLDGHTLNPGDLNWSALEGFGNLKVFSRSTAEEGIERGKWADILVVNKFILDKSNLHLFTQLKYIVVSATGYNNVDVKLAHKLNIPVSNVTGYSASSVAQHVFAVLLSFLNKPYEYHQEIPNGSWSESPDFSYWNETIYELKDKVFGIYGYGAIGKKVCQMATAFDMKVLVNTRSIYQDSENIHFVNIEELFAKSDILSLHAPLTDKNYRIVNKNLLSKMKESAILINTARGDLIHEKDLYNALINNKLNGAFLDVLSNEPPTTDHFLLHLPNCFLTPHLAWASVESRQRLLDGVINNIMRFNSGTLRNKVN